MMGFEEYVGGTMGEAEAIVRAEILAESINPPVCGVPADAAARRAATRAAFERELNPINPLNLISRR